MPIPILPPPQAAKKYMEYTIDEDLRGFNSSVKFPTLKLVRVDRVDGKGIVVCRFRSERHLDNNYGMVHGGAYGVMIDIFASFCVSKNEAAIREDSMVYLMLIRLFSLSPDVATFSFGEGKLMVRDWRNAKPSNHLSPFHTNRSVGRNRELGPFCRKEFGCDPDQHLSHRWPRWRKNQKSCFWNRH